VIGAANTVRGEVELDLAGTRFVLRPSYEAVEACETQTGMSLSDMALAADAGSLKLAQASIVVTEFIRAWGKETKSASASAVKRERIAKLIFEMGVMVALPRLAIVLLSAASGGVDVSGKPKPMPVAKTPPGIGDDLPGSQEPPSGGRRRSSGRQRATSSSDSLKSGSE
jgi:hypothetical protein